MPNTEHTALRSSVAPSGIPDRICEMLLSGNFDGRDVLELLERNEQITPDLAPAILYDVIARINASLFPAITKLELIHTEGCNLACEYCFEKEMLGYRRMSYEVGRRAVDLLFTYSQDKPEVTITHFGGEPTVNYTAVRAITEYTEEKAKSQGKVAKFSMTSNGVLIDDAKAEYFAAHNIKVLLSIDGLRKTHDKYRKDKRGLGTFEQAMQGLGSLKRTQKWIGVKMTVMPDNATNLFDDVLGLYDLGVNQFIIGYATGIEWPEDHMRTFAEQWAKIYHWYKEKPRDDLRVTDFEDLEEEASGPQFGCQAGNDSITVAVDGEISPCSKILALNNAKLMMKLGDVQNGLTHLRNRLELTASSRLIAACEKTGIVDSYQGGCWATNYSDNQDMFQPSMQDQKFKFLQRSACAGCSACR